MLSVAIDRVAAVVMMLGFGATFGFATSAWGQSSDGNALLASQYASLRALSWVSLLLGVAAGLLVYVIRRRALLKFAISAGAIAALLGTLVCFGLSSSVALSPETTACGNSTLMKGDAAKPYDDACRDARESAGNAFGAVSLFRTLFMSAEAGVPVSAGTLKALAWLAIGVLSLALYFLLRPLALRLAVAR